MAPRQYCDGPHAHSALSLDTNLLCTCTGPHTDHTNLFLLLVTGHLAHSHHNAGISLHLTYMYQLSLQENKTAL